MSKRQEKTLENKPCTGCGMLMKTPAQYHPWAACELFKALHDSEAVQGNLREVVRYGMKAAEGGVTLEDAMSNISTVIR